MSENDKKLINDAKRIHYTQWMDINDMIPLAESQEARDRLAVIRNQKYHSEEYHAYLN